MKYQILGNSDLNVSNIGLGCMRMSSKTLAEAKQIINTALECGINFFDHADIYGKGQAEVIFGEAFKELGIERSSVIIQTKCGINQGTFDFSKEHILKSVDESLERLQTDYIDVLLLHRPDALMEPEEINEAFKELKASGKVRWFGVSNQNPYQTQLLANSLDVPLLCNQVQFSIAHTPMLDFGFNVNMGDGPAINRDGGIIEYARLNNMTLQAWSPFYSGYFDKVFVDHPDFPELNEAMSIVGKNYNISNEAVAVAWILRHPANIQTIIGSMNPERIQRICQASEVKITHREWYDLYKAAGNRLP
ncbi:aldo/keto reductase family oxidoreductase [Erysipelothrix sp. HDW6A]|uniref:aldo/keto reductase n=1 Tax=Erysipelothrix sp. HDW6A TaxID=2714928 RepID=UPI00140AF0C1|nr:aldo/keto reductase [Erysipelothrix sp. HDW6A]QIK58145.1 aldo/keto reductase family oxidoreductase [Erysipelothrix sp. HDW6A]